jgi:hypothetical protein
MARKNVPPCRPPCFSGRSLGRRSRMGNRTNCNVRGQSMGTLINGWTCRLVKYGAPWWCVITSVHTASRLCTAKWARQKCVWDRVFASADPVRSHWWAAENQRVQIVRGRRVVIVLWSLLLLLSLLRGVAVNGLSCPSQTLGRTPRDPVRIFDFYPRTLSWSINVPFCLQFYHDWFSDIFASPYYGIIITFNEFWGRSFSLFFFLNKQSLPFLILPSQAPL